MQDPATFVAAGWEVSGFSSDPSGVWIMSPDTGYPLLWYQMAATPQAPLPVFYGGTGTAESPYLIAYAQQLNSVAHNPRLMTAHFRLVGDIDLSGIELLSLGSESVPFAGVFDGNGKTIANLPHTSVGKGPFGVFGHVRGRDARILNTNLLFPRVDALEGHHVGALVGHLYSGTVSNCHVQGGTLSGGLCTGGLVGRHAGYRPASSFWDMQTSGQPTSAGGTGKTTPEMYTARTGISRARLPAARRISGGSARARTIRACGGSAMRISRRPRMGPIGRMRPRSCFL